MPHQCTCLWRLASDSRHPGSGRSGLVAGRGTGFVSSQKLPGTYPPRGTRGSGALVATLAVSGITDMDAYWRDVMKPYHIHQAVLHVLFKDSTVSWPSLASQVGQL